MLNFRFGSRPDSHNVTRKPQRSTIQHWPKKKTGQKFSDPAAPSGPVTNADDRIDHVDILLRSLLTILLSTNDARPGK